ncbi:MULTISPECIES: LTA synthase family protein [Bacteroidales]|mgnify:FL=1|jgi:phosphoglycerol transferase MdoB-like AlkP superfamily enzyme|uniref:LTA synthase family protein n=2 Tax=Bacteroidia TaxID=200643 RepID=UPI00057570E7|nr:MULTISPECIES: alkaline phosphatase family protein [Bacteroidales]KHM46860.1 sulfatase [Coprobacter secundus]
MKHRLFYLIKTYAWFLFIFILQKPIFMIWHYDLYRNVPLSDWFDVMYHGLPLDFSLSAYILVIPVFITLLTVWVQGCWSELVSRVYFGIISLVLSIIFICDIELYSYWGFRMDATPLFYLSSPSDAAASVPLLVMILVPVCIIFYFMCIWFLLSHYIIKNMRNWRFCKHRWKCTISFIFVLAFLFVPIRGGFSVSTMNVGKVYFSSNISLNHAAINPVFSFMTSLSKEKDFKSQYRFMNDEKAEEIFTSLKGGDNYLLEDSLRWIKTDNPDILLIILESFSGAAMDSLCADAPAGIMPNLTQLAKEGLFFTNFYANSFRTDRGLVAVLSGYPAQPTTSIMKYPSKSQSLPAIAKSLVRRGYETQFLYGGDADFTNMRSYFISTGYQSIVCDEDFPISERLSKWGANDEVTFDKFFNLIASQEYHPYMKTFLTLSSHEPFDVPYKKFDDPYLNSVAYTDSCLGAFITKFKKTPQWDNTLVILVADHAMRYPAGIQEADILRHHIPMVWTGGVIKSPRVIYDYASQIDIAATLLGQLGISYDDFIFSKNLANPKQYKFAYYTFKDGFGFLDADNRVVYDNESNSIIISKGKSVERIEERGKAYLQKLYDDLGNR